MHFWKTISIEVRKSNILSLEISGQRSRSKLTRTRPLKNDPFEPTIAQEEIEISITIEIHRIHIIERGIAIKDDRLPGIASISLAVPNH